MKTNTSPVLFLVLALFAWYNVVYGSGSSVYWIIAVVSSVLFIVFFFKTMKLIEAAPLNLLPQEVVVKDYKSIRWSGSTVASIRWGTKNLALTNKRLALSAQFFGVETYKQVLSAFYNKDEYENHKGMTGWFLKDVQIIDEEVRVVLESKTQPFEITWKFKDDVNFIYDVIQKNRKSV